MTGPAPAGEVVKQIQKEYNGLGQLVSACQLSSALGTTSCGQANGGTGYLTTYNYNTDGTVASIVRGSQSQSFTYDALGRTLTATYPESGTTTFSYDTTGCYSTPMKGLLVGKWDANGNFTCYTYDSLNRLVASGSSGPNWDGNNKFFVYDSATVNGVSMVNALGRLAEAYTSPSPTGTKVTDEGYSYTNRGEVSDVYQWSTHSNGWYHTNATYFANHALNTLGGIPGTSGSPWTYSLDGKGRPYSAMETPSANMVGSTTYNAADEPCLVTLGLGDTDSYLYDGNTTCSPSVPLSTGRMTSYTFSIGATPTTFTGSLNWNANGTLRGLATVDGINSGSETETCAYGTSSSPGYDEFGRLLQVNCVNGSTNVWNQTFAYDTYNNITKSVPTGGTGIAWAPGYSATTNRYTLSGTTYDANGNLLTDTFHTYTWNQDNHPTAMTDAGITITYDAFGRMVEKAAGSTYQQMLLSPVGPVALMQKQNLLQYRMPLPGGDADVTGINFYHRDFLGSVPLVSSRGSRASVAARLFAPYGESYNNVGIAGDLDFTGDTQDLVVGTYDTPNRELNPAQGRWISPDPAGIAAINPGNPRGWNRYAYVANDPLSMTDPSGLKPPVSICGTEWCTAYNSGGGGAGGGVNYEFEYMEIPVVPMDSITQIGSNGELQIWVPGTTSGGRWCSPCGLDASGNLIFTGYTLTQGYWSTVSDAGLSYSIAANNQPNPLWGGLVFFKMKNRPIDSGPLNKNFKQPPEPDPIDEMLEAMKEKAEQIAEGAEATLEAIKAILGGGTFIDLPIIMPDVCITNPQLGCGPFAPRPNP